MDQKNLALIENLMDEFRAIKAKARSGIPLSDRDGVRMDEILDELDENGAGDQATDELNAKRHRAIRPEVGPAYQSRGKVFNSLGDQLQAVYRAELPGQEKDLRLFKVAEKRAAFGMSETIPADGGFLIEDTFARELLGSVFATGQLAQLCRRIPISGTSNNLKLNAIAETSRVAGSRLGGVLGYWLSEAGTKTASAPKFRQMELNLKKLIGLCYATDELISDAALLENVIGQGFAEEFGFMVDDAIINGTGVGQPLGIMNSGSMIQVTRNTGSSIKAEDVISMWARLLPGSHSQALWLANPDTLPQLMQMSLAVGTAGGTLLYQPQGGLSEAPYERLLGRRIIWCEQCQTIGTSGDLILADLTRGYVLAEKGGIEAASSIHVRFINDETCFRFVLRLDGQPAINTPITPAKGSNTQSYFVKLS